MKALITLILTLSTLLTSCAQAKVKLLPEYTGVDPRVQSLVDEYMWLSRQNNIIFTRKVTIGFKDIKRGTTIGLCTYSAMFREIDIDITYWNNSTKTSKMALLFHELTHCYCGRGHDYGEDKAYPETEAGRIARAIRWKIEGGERPGYYEDGCPSSFMHPTILDDDCTRAHYQDYVEEMFERCKRW
jgi:hypothetical protein